MKPGELLDLHTNVCSEAHELMERKNQDYCGACDDPPAETVTRWVVGRLSIYGTPQLRCVSISLLAVRARGLRRGNWSLPRNRRQLFV